MNFTYELTPTSVSYQLLSDVKDFILNVVKSNKIDFYVTFETKTRLRIYVQSGSQRYTVNMISLYGQVNALKFFHKKTFSYLTGNSYEEDLFIFNKKQNFPELENHIKSLFKDIIVPRFFASVISEFNSDNVNITCYLSQDLYNLYLANKK